MKLIVTATIACLHFLATNDVFANLFVKDDEIVIQPDYWSGSKCLENGVPYQVPDSIYKEADNCNKEDIVLELGAGGSTIFLARRCKHVTAIETDPVWAEAIKSQLNSLNITNVTLHCMPNPNDIVSFLRKFNTQNVNIFSIDTVLGYNRSLFTNVFLEKGVSPKLRMLVVDNYAEKTMFPYHYDKEIINSKEWEIFRYDDKHWWGNGTKLYIRKN